MKRAGLHKEIIRFVYFLLIIAPINYAIVIPADAVPVITPPRRPVVVVENTINKRSPTFTDNGGKFDDDHSTIPPTATRPISGARLTATSVAVKIVLPAGAR